MKHIPLFLALVSIPSCNYYSAPEEEDVSTVEEEGHAPSTPIGPEYPVANTKKIFTVKIEALNYSAAQKEKLEKASDLLAKVFNSEGYKQEVLSRKFTNDKGLSSEKIYSQLFSGAEALMPAINYQMDLKVKMYYSIKRVVGYTYPNDLIVYTNSKFHDYYSPCQVASNLAHEWTHKMGFDHSSAGDSKSVPYSHNDIVEKLCLLSEKGELK